MIVLLMGSSCPAETPSAGTERKAVERCIGNVSATGIEPMTEQKPYYLRGDFDGDGMPDYAIAVWSASLKKHGVIVCGTKAGRHVLGPVQSNAKIFSDMPNDQFLSNDWQVLTVSDVDQFRKADPRFAAVKGAEAIELVWEDGVAVIYWDGKRVRWYSDE